MLRGWAPSQLEIRGGQSPNIEREQGHEADGAQPDIAIDHLKDRPSVHFGEQARIGEVHALDLAKRNIFERSSPH